MSQHPTFKFQQRGFSLIEIMVGMVIGLLSMVIVLQVFTDFEGQKRTSTSGSDAQTSGATAIFTIERDLRNAGYGFSSTSALGCKINISFNGTASSMFLQHVAITPGLGTDPDSIAMMYSDNDSWSIPTEVTTYHPPQAANVFVTGTIGIKKDDLLLIVEPPLDCTLIQVTGLPDGKQIQHNSGGSPPSLFNPPGGSNVFPPGGYNAGTNKAQIMNLGQLASKTYSIGNLSSNKNNLVVTEFSTTAGFAGPSVNLVSDIVALKAQYGFDTRAGPQLNAVVNTWSNIMVDADNNGTTGNGGDTARIYAVRLAIVARSGLKEKANAANVCNTTTIAPTWVGSSDVGGPIDLSADPEWNCYRYKTFETVVPLRNLIWRQL